MTSLPANLRAAIARRGLTITAAAELCHIGRVTMQRYVTGQQSPSLAKLEGIAAALGTTAAKLLKEVAPS